MKVYKLLLFLLITQISWAQNCPNPIGNPNFSLIPGVTSFPFDTQVELINDGYVPTQFVKGNYYQLFISSQVLGKTLTIGNCSTLGATDDGSLAGTAITIFDANGNILAQNLNLNAGGVCTQYTPSQSGNVYVLITNATCGTGSQFNTIGLQCTTCASIPTNDSEYAAIALTSGNCGSAQIVLGSTENATNTAFPGGYTGPICSNSSCGGGVTAYPRDIWYKFNSLNNTDLTLTITGKSGFAQSLPPSLVRIFYSPNGYDQFSPFDCRCSSSSTPLNNVYLTGLTPNSIYFVAVSPKIGTSGFYTDFSISIANGTCSPCNTPNVNSPTIQVGTSATLTATSCTGSIKWYNSSVGGTLLHTGSSYTTNTINSSGVYEFHAECVGTNCSIQSRKKSIVTVQEACNSAVVNSPTISSGNAAQLNATGCLGTVNWYAQASGGAILSTGLSYTTPVMTAPPSNYHYYAECIESNCVLQARSVSTITVNPNVPCPSVLNFINDSVNNFNFFTTPIPIKQQASQHILANNLISGIETQVSYQAGNFIELQPGFQANSGSIFLVEISGCN